MTKQMLSVNQFVLLPSVNRSDIHHLLLENAHPSFSDSESFERVENIGECSILNILKHACMCSSPWQRLDSELLTSPPLIRRVKAE